MTRATLNEIRHAVESAVAYLEMSGHVPLQEAVDVACDYLGIPAEADRRIVRNAVRRRRGEAQPRVEGSARRPA